LNSNTSVSLNTAQYRRVGSDLIISGLVDYNGAGASGTFTVSLPSGDSIDPNAVTSTTVGSPNFGQWGWFDATGSAASRGGYVTYNTATTLQFQRNDTSNPVDSSAFAASDKINFQVAVPIAGWSSNTVMSSDTDTGMVALIANTSSTAATSSSPYKFSNVVKDTRGGYNASTGVYTVKVTGLYFIDAAIMQSNSDSSLTIRQNGSVVAKQTVSAGTATTQSLPISAVIYAKADDTIDVAPGTSATASGTATENYFNVVLLNGNVTVAASESVNAKYNTSSTVITSSATTIKFTSKEFDSHNDYDTSTGDYTIPISGKYRISATVTGNSLSGANSEILQLSVAKNGTAVTTLGRFIFQATVGDNPFVAGTTTLSLLPDDVITIQAITVNSLGNVTLDGSSTNNHFEIERVGN
jgi:hypothetical protein